MAVVAMAGVDTLVVTLAAATVTQAQGAWAGAKRRTE